MPASVASLIAGLSASGPDGLRTIAFTPWAMSVRMSASWPGASVSRWMIVTLDTLPALTAWAFAEQSMASRQPLPTPPAFEKPIVYLAFAAPADGAADEPHAVTTTAITARAANPRANPILFMYLNPPPLPTASPHGLSAGP